MKVETIDIKKLRLNPITIKRYGKFDLSNDDDLELWESIITDGIFQRPVVTKNYLIINGNRRVQAALNCIKIKKIEVEVIDIEDDEVTEYIIVTYQISRTRDEITAALEYSLINEEKKIRQGRKGVREIIEKIRSEVVKSVKKSERTIKKVVQSVNFYKETKNCSDVDAWEFVTKEKRVNNKSVDKIFKETKEAHTKKFKIKKENYPIEYQDEWFKIYNRSNEDLRDVIPDEHINVSISSPPYAFSVRNYNLGKAKKSVKVQKGQETTAKEYIKNQMKSYREAIRTLKQSGSLWINVADSRKDGVHYDISGRFIAAMEDEGMKLAQKIVWTKNNPVYQDRKATQPSCEFILHFVKDVKKYKYNKDWIDEADNFYGEVTYGGKDKKRQFKNVLFYYSDHKISGFGGTLKTGVIDNTAVEKLIKSKGLDFDHKALFLLEVPMICILSTADRGDTICDIYSGMGTTGIVAYAYDCKYYGIDISDVYTQQSIIRLKDWVEQLNKTKGLSLVQ